MRKIKKRNNQRQIQRNNQNAIINVMINLLDAQIHIKVYL